MTFSTRCWGLCDGGRRSSRPVFFFLAGQTTIRSADPAGHFEPEAQHHCTVVFRV